MVGIFGSKKGGNILDKKILSDYIDACELIKETEKDIHRLNKKKRIIVQTNVTGSNPNFPYEKKHFKIAGTTITLEEDSKLRYEEQILIKRKKNAEEIKGQVEEFLNTIPVRMQRIIRMKYFEDKTWDEIANKLGRKATADSVRKELGRLLEEK